MPLQLPPLVNMNTNIAPPANPVDQAAKISSLQNMMSEQALRNQLAPLQVQEAQERVKQQQQANELAAASVASQKAMMAAVANGSLNKYASTDATANGGTGFDAAGAYQDLIRQGVLPEHANTYVSSIQTAAKNTSEIRKNSEQANVDYLKNRSESHEQMADDIAGILKLPAEQQQSALTNLQRAYVAKPLPGVDPNDMKLFAQADIAHLPALAGTLDLHSKIEDINAKQAKQAAETSSAQSGAKKGEIETAAPTQQQLQTAAQTLNSYTIIPQNLRAGLANELKNAPTYSDMQRVQQRVDAANESFQRSADAQEQAKAMRDVGTKNLVAGKLVAEDEKLGSSLDQTGGIRGLLDMSKGGNQAATPAALTRFAEHEIVEGGVKRMNETEYKNLAGSLGSYGRKFSAWVDGGYKGQMPDATNSEIHAILDAEDKAVTNTHERNVGYITDRYVSPQTASPTKGGKGSSASGASGSQIPANVTKALSGIGVGRHTLSDGSVWDKRADGTVGRAQ